MLMVRCYSLIPGPSPPPGRPRRPSSRGLPPLNSTHFTDGLSGTRLFSRARNRWLERHPEKPGRRRPRCPSSADVPCPSKTRTPKKPRNVRRRSVPGAADAPRRQPTCRVASPNAAAVAASVSPTAARPGSRSIVSAGRCSGDTEGGGSEARSHRPHAGSPCRPGRRAAAPSLPSPRRRAGTAGAGRSLRRFRGAGGRGQRWSPPYLHRTPTPRPRALSGLGGNPTHRFLSW